jgi:hypothetical protein
MDTVVGGAADTDSATILRAGECGACHLACYRQIGQDAESCGIRCCTPIQSDRHDGVVGADGGIHLVISRRIHNNASTAWLLGKLLRLFFLRLRLRCAPEKGLQESARTGGERIE